MRSGKAACLGEEAGNKVGIRAFLKFRTEKPVSKGMSFVEEGRWFRSVIQQDNKMTLGIQV
jgi:hypothetical protein